MGTRNVSVVRPAYKPMPTVKQVGLAGDSIGGIYHHSNDDIAVRYTSFTLAFYSISQTHTRYAFQNRATRCRVESCPGVESFFALLYQDRRHRVSWLVPRRYS